MSFRPSSALAATLASAAECAARMPPADMRSPAPTWALTKTGSRPRSVAATSASSGVAATIPGGACDGVARQELLRIAFQNLHGVDLQHPAALRIWPALPLWPADPNSERPAQATSKTESAISAKNS